MDRPPGARSIDELLAQVRTRIDRVQPQEVPARLAAGARPGGTRAGGRRRPGRGGGALRGAAGPGERRRRDGAVPGALVVDRNVLEWRLDPASPDRLPQVTGYDLEVVLLCNEGYSSRLA